MTILQVEPSFGERAVCRVVDLLLLGVAETDLHLSLIHI